MTACCSRGILAPVSARPPRDDSERKRADVDPPATEPARKPRKSPLPQEYPNIVSFEEVLERRSESGYALLEGEDEAEGGEGEAGEAAGEGVSRPRPAR
jgi:hypothetical protein